MSRGKKGLFSGLALLGWGLLRGGSVGAQTMTSGEIGGADNLAPGPVAEVVATAAEDNATVTIKWMTSEDDFIHQTAAGTDFTSGGVFISVNDVAGYNVLLSVDDGTAEAVNTTLLAPSATSYTHEGLPTGASLVYSVVAVDAAGNTSRAVEAEEISLGAQLTVSETDLDFGFITEDDATVTKTVTINNGGSADLVVSLSVTGDGFSISGDTERTIVDGGETVVEVTFDAAAVSNVKGVYTGALTITSDDLDEPLAVVLLAEIIGQAQSQVEVVGAPPATQQRQVVYDVNLEEVDPVQLALDTFFALTGLTQDDVTHEVTDGVLSITILPTGPIITATITAGSVIITFEVVPSEDPEAPTPEELLQQIDQTVEEDPEVLADIAPLVSFGTVTVSKVDLGTVEVDGVATQALSFTNSSTDPDAILAVNLEVSGEGYSLSETELRIAQGETGSADITFDANAVMGPAGTYDGLVTMLTNDPDNPSSIIDLTATLLPPPSPVIDLSGVEFKFAQVQIDDSASKILTISNKGEGDLEATLAVSGDDVFTVDPASITVVAGEKGEVTVTFAPVAEKEYSGTITITSNDPANPEKTVTVAGVGVVEVALLLPGDFDSSGDVGFDDFFLFADQFGTTTDSPTWSAIYDLDASGDVGFDDFFIFADNFGKSLPAE